MPCCELLFMVNNDSAQVLPFTIHAISAVENSYLVVGLNNNFVIKKVTNAVLDIGFYARVVSVTVNADGNR